MFANIFLKYMHGCTIVASIPTDYRHAVLEGVTRRLMTSRFASKFHMEPF